MSTDCRFDLRSYERILPQEFFGGFATLPKQAAVIAIEGTLLLDDFYRRANIQDVADLADTLGKHDVKLGFLERRRDFVLGHAHARPVADVVLTALDRLNTANIQAQAGVEFERASACRRLRVAEHDADL